MGTVGSRVGESRKQGGEVEEVRMGREARVGREM